MFSAIRRRMTYANVVATLAMVFAMTGGAYAASKYLITSTKQIKPAVLASLKGAKGAAGASGAQGTAGPQGAAGAAGKEGPAGKDGKEGPAGKEGPRGKEGQEGIEGSPWTATGTLPSGKTETGTWAVGEVTAGAKPLASAPLRVPISFAIPLATGLTSNEVHFINKANKEVISPGNEATSHPLCPGTVAAPAAAPGNLCVYTGFNFFEAVESRNGAIVRPDSVGTGPPDGGTSVAGAVLQLTILEEEAAVSGTWAVTESE